MPQVADPTPVFSVYFGGITGLETQQRVAGPLIKTGTQQKPGLDVTTTAGESAGHSDGQGPRSSMVTGH